jgi:hypothetical protein
MLINYDIGAGGSIAAAEFPGGAGGNGSIKITWT